MKIKHCVECPVVVAFVSVVAYVSRLNHVMIIFFFFEFCSRSLICDSSLSILASFSLTTATSVCKQCCWCACDVCGRPLWHVDVWLHIFHQGTKSLLCHAAGWWHCCRCWCMLVWSLFIWSVGADDMGPSFFKDVHACPVLTCHSFPAQKFYVCTLTETNVTCMM